jgi:hypothetical protein
MSEVGPLYVYGICRSGTRAPASGLDGRSIRPVAVDGLAALVSDAGPGPVEATRDRLLTHARVLEEIARHETVLPMRFGVVAPSEAALLEGVLAPRRRQLAKLLDRLEGLVEIDVRVFYEEEPVLREIVEKDPAIRRLRMRTQALPDDAGYYARVELGEAVAQAMRGLAARDSKRIAGILGPLAVDVRRREPTLEGMVANDAFLVRREYVDRFEREVRSLEAGGRVRTRTKGPLPPYSFVDERIDPTERRGRRWAS